MSRKRLAIYTLFLLIWSFLLFSPLYSAKGESLLKELSRKEKIQHVKQYLNMGLDFFSSGSYEQAMAYFFSAIKYKDLSYLPEYQEAMYYLAESYFQTGMLSQAYQTYRKILALYGESFPFYTDSIQRLLEITIYLKKFREAIGYFKILRNILPPEAFENRALYLLGVSYFNMGKYRQAKNFFIHMRKEGKYYLQSRYYIASIDLLLNNPVESYRIFRDLRNSIKVQLKKASYNNPEKITRLKDFYDLVTLAVGRLFFEAGDYDRARKYYLAVTSTSRYYDQALYERAWVWAMKKQYGKTYQILYQLAEEIPDSPLIPKAQLLYGYCYIEENRYRDAEREFKRYLKKYGGLEDLLRKIINTHKDPAEFYKEIMVKSETTIGGLEIPPDILLRLKKSPRIKKSELLVKDVEEMKKDLESISKKLEEVKLLAERAGKQTIIPGTIFSHNRIRRIMYVLKTIEIKLLQYKQAEVINAISLEGAKVLGDLYTLRNITTYLSDTLDALNDRLNAKKSELLSILDFITKVLPPDAITAYRLGNMKQLTPEEIHYLKAKKEIEKQLGELNQLVPVIQNYSRRISALRQATFVLERKVMAHFAQKVQYRRKKYLKKIDSLLNKVEYLRNQIRLLKEEMVRKKQRAVEEVKKEIVTKEKILAQYIRSLQHLQKEAEKVRGDTLVSELDKYRKEMDFYTMQAHMGFIDISWNIKEENEHRVDALYAARADEINAAENYYNNLISLARKKPEKKIKFSGITTLKPVSIDNLDKLEEGLDLKNSIYGFNFREIGEDIVKKEDKVKYYSSVITTIKNNPFNPLKPVKIKKKKGKSVYLRLRIINKMGWQYKIVKVEAFIDGFLLFQNSKIQQLEHPEDFIGFAGMILPGAHQVEIKFYIKTKGFLFWKPKKKKIVFKDNYYFDCAPKDTVNLEFIVGRKDETPQLKVEIRKKRGTTKAEAQTK